MTRNTLTTIGDLNVDDVFCRPNHAQHYRIISKQQHQDKAKHVYAALAILVNADSLAPRSFKKNEQVVFLRRVICV